MHQRLICQPCRSRHRRHLRAASPDTYLATRLWGNYRSRDLDNHELSADWLSALYQVQSGRCAVTNIPMTHSDEQLPTNISLDRIDSSIPYTRANVQLVCYVVNIMKGSLPLDDFLSWCSLISQRSRPPGGGPAPN